MIYVQELLAKIEKAEARSLKSYLKVSLLRVYDRARQSLFRLQVFFIQLRT